MGRKKEKCGLLVGKYCRRSPSFFFYWINELLSNKYWKNTNANIIDRRDEETNIVVYWKKPRRKVFYKE